MIMNILHGMRKCTATCLEEMYMYVYIKSQVKKLLLLVDGIPLSKFMIKQYFGARLQIDGSN